MSQILKIPETILPYRGKTQVWRRIHELEQQTKTIVSLMYTLTDEFKQTFEPPWPIHLSSQQVKSGTVYCRWRNSGSAGQQPYLHFCRKSGQAFLSKQPANIRKTFLRFNQDALDMMLAHSLRMNEIRRLKKYIEHLEALNHGKPFCTK